MLGWLFILFIGLPLADLVLLLRIGGVLGFWPTVGIVLATGFAGAALARWQGLRTLARIQGELADGRMPGDDLADGALILLAAALLVTPGFLTDLLGVFLLIPVTRRLFRGALRRYFTRRTAVAHFTIRTVQSREGEMTSQTCGAGVGQPGTSSADAPRVVASRVIDGSRN